MIIICDVCKNMNLYFMTLLRVSVLTICNYTNNNIAARVYFPMSKLKSGLQCVVTCDRF